MNISKEVVEDNCVALLYEFYALILSPKRP